MEVMVGTAMKASMIEALSMFTPNRMSKRESMMGATTAMPKKPMTTEGREASSSTMGLMISRTFRGAISAR
jgi:hypothetical protein